MEHDPHLEGNEEVDRCFALFRVLSKSKSHGMRSLGQIAFFYRAVVLWKAGSVQKSAGKTTTESRRQTSLLWLFFCLEPTRARLSFCGTNYEIFAANPFKGHPSMIPEFQDHNH